MEYFQHDNLILSLFIALVYGVLVSTTTKQLLNPRLMPNGTRRILRGIEAHDRLPFMVYLRAASNDAKLRDPNWLCGGVIVHEQYILTSAACIEDAKLFYVVSGTHRWTPSSGNDECITNGAKRATWKVVPKHYIYDGDQLNNIRWMHNDIAVVRVEENFNFQKRVRGCDFIPKKLSYNNQSVNLEEPGTTGTIAGWGSIDRFGNEFGTSTVNSPNLLETSVVLISKKNCIKEWPNRYHYIIEESMICAKDGGEGDYSHICEGQVGKCKELTYSEEDKTVLRNARRFIVDPNKLDVHTAAHEGTSRRASVTSAGGFCENDHGGPLVVGHGPTAVVIGIISACLTANITRKCYGPFLYTSVWNNRQLIDCAIDRTGACLKQLRSTHFDEMQFDWSDQREGPSNLDIDKENSRFEVLNREGYTAKPQKG